jgi:hypothetical protein
MKSRPIIFAAGLAMFAVSFFLWGVTDVRGYMCAYFALVFPWVEDGRHLLLERPLEFVSIVLSGWINPIFLITLLLGWRRASARLVRFLKGEVVTMMLFCWPVFYYESVRPRAGYFLWTAGMLMTLFAYKAAGRWTLGASNSASQERTAASL